MVILQTNKSIYNDIEFPMVYYFITIIQYKKDDTDFLFYSIIRISYGQFCKHAPFFVETTNY